MQVMREQGLIQRRRSLPRRKRPGFFRVDRPGQLWHMDMTSVWVAEQGWCYLNAIIDCCTREIVGWGLERRCRAKEAIAVLEAALARSCFIPDELQVGDEAERLTLGTDNGSAFTSRAFKAVLAEHEVGHRRGGYRDPESQAFIESWFAKLKEREVWLNEYPPRPSRSARACPGVPNLMYPSRTRVALSVGATSNANLIRLIVAA